MSPPNWRDELDRLIQARTNFQHQSGTPADAAVQAKAALMDHLMPVPEADGQLDLGWSQGVFVYEFDGPRSRPVQVCPFVNG